MKSRSRFLKLIYFILILLVTFGLSSARTKQAATENKYLDLYNEIARMDSILFNAFNKRDTVLFKNMFSKDLEFYHDQDGVTGYDHTINFLKEVSEKNNGLRRELVRGSLEVYPVPGYGAMEIGEHKFCHLENGKENCGTFKFVHIWQKKNNDWKITRVISYGH